MVGDASGAKACYFAHPTAIREIRIRSGTRQSFDTTDESTKVGRLPLRDFERQVVGWVENELQRVCHPPSFRTCHLACFVADGGRRKRR